MTINGTIIGKEMCNTDSSKNYWLVDLKPTINVPDYGDTLIVGDSTYNHVVKVKGLYKPLQKIGLSVVFDFKQISQHNVHSTDCNIPSPITYELKELYILNQGIRTP